MNPVAAGMVESPEAYRWSSYRNNAWGKQNAVVSPHELYQALGDDADQRQHHYRELYRYMLPDEQIHEIREALTYNYPLGKDRFRQQIEGMPGRAVGEKKRGRPLKQRAV